jgi:hypothetical protein
MTVLTISDHESENSNVGDRVWLVTFMQYDLGYFDDEAARVQPIDYPFGSKVLPYVLGINCNPCVRNGPRTRRRRT